jgi:hypothetical protein
MRVYEGQAYVVERNKLIPQAVQLANKLYGKRCDKEESKEIFAQNWNRCFHGEMNRLVKERGL